ncbi:MAG: hypothetical protein WDO73_13420 [Ignavibacteriota bacterium]
MTPDRSGWDSDWTARANRSAYDAVVYRKGAYVLHMLRMMMYDNQTGDKAFIDMMHDFVSQYMNKDASTEAFQRVVEKHMSPQTNLAGNGKMDWFFSEWLFGTTVPRYKFDYTLTDADGGKCILKGTVTQSDVNANFLMPVPVYVDLDGRVARLGTINLFGNSTSKEINVMLPKRPKRVMLNYWHDILEAL